MNWRASHGRRRRSREPVPVHFGALLNEDRESKIVRLCNPLFQSRCTYDEHRVTCVSCIVSLANLSTVRMIVQLRALKRSRMLENLHKPDVVVQRSP